MKKIFLLILALAIAATAAAVPSAGYSPQLIHVLEQLRKSVGSFILDMNGKPEPQLPFIGGSSTGLAEPPGEFFLLIPYFESLATEHDISLMVKDRSPS